MLRTRTGTLIQSVVVSVLEKECVECEKRAVSQLSYPALVGSWQLRGGWGPVVGWLGSSSRHSPSERRYRHNTQLGSPTRS